MNAANAASPPCAATTQAASRHDTARAYRCNVDKRASAKPPSSSEIAELSSMSRLQKAPKQALADASIFVSFKKSLILELLIEVEVEIVGRRLNFGRAR
jgi:hypothetical protein